MLSLIKKTTVTLVAGSLFLASSALAFEPKSGEPTIVKPDWNYNKYVKETSNDLLKPQKIEINWYYPKEQYQQEASHKLEVVPIQYGYSTYEKYDPDADYVDENEYSSEPELNSSSDESESSSNGDEGDVIADDGSDSEPSISDGSLEEATYSANEGKTTPNTSGLKLPEFGSLINKDNEETAPADPSEDEASIDLPDDEEMTELDTVTTTIKIKIVLEDIEYEDGSMNATLLKDGVTILDSGSVTFKPSETVANKGTLVVEFDNTENVSHNGIDTLLITSKVGFTLVSYAVSISKKVKLEDTTIPVSSDETILPLSFLTDTSETDLSSAPSYTTSVKVNYVVQQSEDETFDTESVNTEVYDADSVALDLGTGTKSFNESSTVEGKGTFTTTYTPTWGTSFNNIAKVELKTDGSVSAELLNYSVEIEKKVKPSDTTFTPTEDTDTLSLPVF